MGPRPLVLGCIGNGFSSIKPTSVKYKITDVVPLTVTIWSSDRPPILLVRSVVCNRFIDLHKQLDTEPNSDLHAPACPIVGQYQAVVSNTGSWGTTISPLPPCLCPTRLQSRQISRAVLRFQRGTEPPRRLHARRNYAAGTSSRGDSKVFLEKIAAPYVKPSRTNRRSKISTRSSVRMLDIKTALSWYSE